MNFKIYVNAYKLSMLLEGLWTYLHYPRIHPIPNLIEASSMPPPFLFTYMIRAGMPFSSQHRISSSLISTPVSEFAVHSLLLKITLLSIRRACVFGIASLSNSQKQADFQAG